MPPNLSKDILKLAAKLIKHQAKKQLGDGFIDTLSKQLVDYAGDNVSEKVNGWLDSGENAEKLLLAFQDADKAFHDQGDDTFKQMIISKPLMQLETLEKLAKVLPETLDDEGLLEALRRRFESDWSNLPSEVHEKAARAYQLNLERSLAVRCNQMLPSIFTKVERIEANTEKILDKLDSFTLQQAISLSNWYLPFPRNEKFVGREDDLENIHTVLQKGENVGVRPAMLSGMGGIGKTQLAVEYAYRYKGSYPGGIYWVNAAQDLLIKGMADTAEKIGLRPTSDIPESQSLTWLANEFAKHLNSQQDVLVIFDNVEDPKVLRLPVGSFVLTELKCHILFTTRRRDVNKTFYHSFDVSVLPEAAAIKLLLRHPSRQQVLDPKHTDHAIARIICMTLGFLPLAIELAGAYLGKYEEIPLWDYRVRLLDEGAMETVDDTDLHHEDMPTRHDTAINATLKLSWEAIQDDSDAQLALKAAGQLREAGLVSIRLLSLLTGIENRIVQGRPNLLVRALKKLYEFSLVEKLTSNNLRLHPLVFGFVSHMAGSDFRIKLATQLSKKLCNVETLIQMIEKDGVDEILGDTQVALWLYGSNNLKLKNELYTLNLLLNNEWHVLRTWDPNEQPTFLIQQLYTRAFTQDAKEWRDRFGEYLNSNNLTWLEEKKPFSRVSPAFLRIFEGHTSAINSVAITPDGRRAISASDDRTLHLWDLDSGQQLQTFEGHTSAINSVAIAPDGRRAISASNDRTLRMWDFESGQQLRIFEGHTSAINSVAITSDGKCALSASFKILCLWDLDNGQQLRVFEGHTSWVRNVAITADGKRALSADESLLRLWDLDSGQQLQTFEGHTSAINSVAIAPDGRRAISASNDRTLRLWDLDSGQQLHTFEGDYKFTSVAITTDGKHALSTDGSLLRLWDLDSGQQLHTFEGHTSPINSVAIAPDGRRAISASSDLYLWDIENSQQLRTFEGHSSAIKSVAITPDERHAISASPDRTLRLWDLDSGQQLLTFNVHDEVRSMAITPDGKRAITDSGHTLRLWDLDSGQQLHTFKGHSAIINDVAITPDGTCVISASQDHTLRLWDLETGQQLLSIEGYGNVNVKCVAVTPDGKRAIFGSDDHTLSLWDLKSGKQLRTFKGHNDWVNDVAITPDGRRAISASSDHTLRLWDLESGKHLHTFEGHTSMVNGVAVSSDGRRAVSASSDKTLRLWDLQNGKCLLLLSADAQFNVIAIHPDGKKVVAGDIHGVMHFIEIHQLK